MQIGCTETLRKYIKREIGAVDAAADPFYTWSANLLTIDRRKVIAVVNDENRCGFLLYGIKTSDLGKLEQLLQEGLRHMLQALRIDPQLAQRYIDDCGAEIVYTKTKDRSVVARLNKFCSRLKWTADHYFLPDDRYQDAALLRMNNDIMLYSKGYENAVLTLEALEQGFERHYPGEPIYRCEMAKLKITLLGTDCSRVVLVPMDVHLDDLHTIIQTCFAWENEHLHQFGLKKGARTFWSLLDIFPQYEGMAKETLWDEPDSSLVEPYISLAEMFQKHRVLYYEYDFRDGWEHKINFMGKSVETKNIYARCIAAVGDAPPEDCGGPFGFARLKEVLQNPDDEEYESLTEWLGDTKLMPVDINRINGLLKALI